ncbi:MAG: polyhydroxyalkanoic acid system family protein [Chlorobi bacterium]|nr:polyhydroxyalkanoic acid system family protein [Chlorobiota bacterium]
MPDIRIERYHTLGKESAKRSVDGIARQLKSTLNATCDWYGDEMVIRSSGTDGRIKVSENQIVLEVNLGLMLSPMKSTIEREINRQLDTRLGTGKGG